MNLEEGEDFLSKLYEKAVREDCEVQGGGVQDGEGQHGEVYGGDVQDGEGKHDDVNGGDVHDGQGKENDVKDGEVLMG